MPRSSLVAVGQQRRLELALCLVACSTMWGAAAQPTPAERCSAPARIAHQQRTTSASVYSQFSRNVSSPHAFYCSQGTLHITRPLGTEQLPSNLGCVRSLAPLLFNDQSVITANGAGLVVHVLHEQGDKGQRNASLLQLNATTSTFFNMTGHTLFAAYKACSRTRCYALISAGPDGLYSVTVAADGTISAAWTQARNSQAPRAVTVSPSVSQPRRTCQSDARCAFVPGLASSACQRAAYVIAETGHAYAIALASAAFIWSADLFQGSTWPGTHSSGAWRATFEVSEALGLLHVVLYVAPAAGAAPMARAVSLRLKDGSVVAHGSLFPLHHTPRLSITPDGSVALVDDHGHLAIVNMTASESPAVHVSSLEPCAPSGTVVDALAPLTLCNGSIWAETWTAHTLAAGDGTKSALLCLWSVSAASGLMQSVGCVTVHTSGLLSLSALRYSTGYVTLMTGPVTTSVATNLTYCSEPPPEDCPGVAKVPKRRKPKRWKVIVWTASTVSCLCMASSVVLTCCWTLYQGAFSRERRATMHAGLAPDLAERKIVEYKEALEVTDDPELRRDLLQAIHLATLLRDAALRHLQGNKHGAGARESVAASRSSYLPSAWRGVKRAGSMPRTQSTSDTSSLSLARDRSVIRLPAAGKASLSVQVKRSESESLSDSEG